MNISNFKSQLKTVTKPILRKACDLSVEKRIGPLIFIIVDCSLTLDRSSGKGYGITIGPGYISLNKDYDIWKMWGKDYIGWVFAEDRSSEEEMEKVAKYCNRDYKRHN